MKRSTDRILTSHVGSLVRPPEVAAMFPRPAGKPFDDAEKQTLRRTVNEAVKEQVATGIDIPSDGEFSKSGFSAYLSDRLSGFESRPGRAPFQRGRDRTRFAEAYAEMESPAAPSGARINANQNMVCTGPVTYTGAQLVKDDIAIFKEAMQAAGVEEGFIPATAPGTIELQRTNEYYKTNEEYLYAIADSMHEEYKLIVDAGFLLQIDDPRGVTAWDGFDPEPAPEEYRKFAALRVEALNHALRGLPEDRIRYHVCWGSWHGPHTTDVPLKHIIDVTLQIKAQAYSIEAANPRHAHEYHVFEATKLPEGKILIPGVIAHTTNCVEHPELVAERIVNYAKLVGRENVIAGADCGFAQGFATQRVHPSIMWEKFRMLAEGSRLATQQLWR
ncbi:MAG TPA: cobalamin-independent methionine synthase II family protein [Dehalococcoidia bacterium]|nr:cobalamin-independent methionine synthase II family protein [Dehalococcoidia bacterium]